MELRKALITEILDIIHGARAAAVRSVDVERTLMYWKIGQKIFEEEQGGKERAAYGTQLIPALAAELQPVYGPAFSKRNLDWYRQFYRTFPIVNALRSQFSWTHYRNLIQIESSDKREFYIAEAAKNNWTARQLERRVNSLLYERLLMSNNRGTILAIARDEQVPHSPQEIMKDPMVLEALGLKGNAAYREYEPARAALLQHSATGGLLAFRNFAAPFGPRYPLLSFCATRRKADAAKRISASIAGGAAREAARA